MTEHSNVELVRDAYAAISEGDGGPFMAILADGIKWHYPGRSPVAGDFEGKDAVAEHWHALDAAAGGMKVKVAAVLGDDHFAIAIEHVTAERNGKSYDRHDVVVFRIKEGKVAEGWVYPESQYEIDDLLS